MIQTILAAHPTNQTVQITPKTWSVPQPNQQSNPANCSSHPPIIPNFSEGTSPLIRSETAVTNCPAGRHPHRKWSSMSPSAADAVRRHRAIPCPLIVPRPPSTPSEHGDRPVSSDHASGRRRPSRPCNSTSRRRILLDNRLLLLLLLWSPILDSPGEVLQYLQLRLIQSSTSVHT